MTSTDRDEPDGRFLARWVGKEARPYVGWGFVGVGVLLRRALERAEDPDAWDTTEAMRRAARRSGLDQGELAARAATSRTRMNSYLTGAQLPSARTARRIQRIAARIGTAG